MKEHSWNWISGVLQPFLKFLLLEAIFFRGCALTNTDDFIEYSEIPCNTVSYEEEINCQLDKPDFLKEKIEAEIGVIGKTPWMVSLRDFRYDPPYPFCGGVIIDMEWILTTAFCVQAYQPHNVKVVAGEHNTMSTEKGQQQVEASEIILHEGFSSFDHSNDIALLKVEPSFQSSLRVAAIALNPNATEENHIGEICEAHGWGLEEESGITNPVLLEANVTVLSNLECRRKYSDGLISRLMVCASVEIELPCMGFWGSPLVCGGSELVGIASWSNGCGNIDHPIVFMEVKKYLDWIQDKVDL